MRKELRMGEHPAAGVTRWHNKLMKQHHRAKHYYQGRKHRNLTMAQNNVDLIGEKKDNNEKLLKL